MVLGSGDGHGYAVNVPLDSDVNDVTLVSIFKSVVGKVKSIYDPEVIVFQVSLSGLRKNS